MAEGWGAADFLPASVLKAQAIEERAERREARDAERQRAEYLEQRHERAVSSWKAMAEERGEMVTAMQIATGEGLGRTLEDVFETSRMLADREDARERARLAREGTPPPEHIWFDEPRILQPVTPAKRSALIKSRRFTEWKQKQAAADAARKALEHELDYGLVASQRPAPKADPVIDGTVSRRAQAEPYGENIRIRGGGPIVGIW